MSMLDDLVQILEEREMNYEVNSSRQAVKMDVLGSVGAYRFVFKTDENNNLFYCQLFCYCPVNCPPDKRSVIAETLTRANNGLQVGAFEMDMADGRIDFHITHLNDTDSIADLVVDNIVSLALIMMDMYLPAILSVIFGKVSPEKAIQVVEKNGLREREESGESPRKLSLTDRLQQAIESEDYAEAARLRDVIAKQDEDPREGQDREGQDLS